MGCADAGVPLLTSFCYTVMLSGNLIIPESNGDAICYKVKRSGWDVMELKGNNMYKVSIVIDKIQFIWTRELVDDGTTPMRCVPRLTFAFRFVHVFIVRKESSNKFRRISYCSVGSLEIVFIHEIFERIMMALHKVALSEMPKTQLETCPSPPVLLLTRRVSC